MQFMEEKGPEDSDEEVWISKRQIEMHFEKLKERFRVQEEARSAMRAARQE